MKIRFLLLFTLGLFYYNQSCGQCTNCYQPTTGTYASALGKVNSAIGEASFASGGYSTAEGIFSTSLGFRNNAIGIYSFTIGSFLEANASNATVIGTGDNTSYKLSNNVSNSLMIGFNSDLPTLFVSPSVLGHGYTGKIGIGNVTDPEAKLHIKADQGESASFLLEPNSWGSASYADIYIGNTNHGIRADQRYGLVFKTEDDFIFSQGKVGIGSVLYPEAKLHIKCSQGEDANLLIEPFKDEIESGEDSWQAGLYLNDFEHGITGHSDLGLVFNTEHDFIFNSGSMGVGTDNPIGKIHVVDENCEMAFSDEGFYINSTSIESSSSINLMSQGRCIWGIESPFSEENNRLRFTYNDVEKMALTDQGKLVIGNLNEIPDGYMLYVSEGILTEKVKVALQTSDEWYDHVFDDDYELMSLYNLEKYILKNRHLPEIPSTEEVIEDGLDLGEMNAKLLQKIEELTLYIIKQQKEIDELKKKIK